MPCLRDSDGLPAAGPPAGGLGGQRKHDEGQSLIPDVSLSTKMATCAIKREASTPSLSLGRLPVPTCHLKGCRGLEIGRVGRHPQWRPPLAGRRAGAETPRTF